MSGAEIRVSLWLPVIAPSIWISHFLLSYITAAVWCAKVADNGGNLGTARIAVGLYTALALAGIALVSRHGLRLLYTNSERSAAQPRRFLGFTTLLLCGLACMATLYGALPALLIGNCC